MKEWVKKAKKAARQKNFEQAGDFYYLAEDFDNALTMYLRGEHYDLAAKLCEKIGEIEEAAEYYREAQDYMSSADCYHRIKKYKEGSLMYQRGKDFYKAAEMSQKAGDFLRAAQMMEKTSYPDKAAFLYMKAKDNLKAAQIFEKLFLSYKQKDRQYKDSTPFDEDKFEEYGILCAEQFVKAEEYKKAADYYRQLGHNKKAARAYNLAGLPQKVLECLIEEQSYSKALELIKNNPSLKIEPELMGKLYKGTGDYEKAAQYFIKADEKVEASEAHQLAGNFLQAAKIWEELKDYLKAAALYVKGGDNKQAACMYEKEGEALLAAKLYYDAEEFSKAASLYLKAEEYILAAEIYQKLNKGEEYIETLQKISQDLSDYRKACSMLGKAFMEKGLFSVAEKKLLQAIEGVELTNKNKEIYYILSQVYEHTNKFDKAKEIYEKLISLDYRYKDVAQRIEKLRDIEEAIPTQLITKELVSSIKAKRGTIIANRYDIKKEIGQGGMGKVYLVHDMHLDELIALKLLMQYMGANEAQVKRFIHEIKITRKINHPNVIRVFDLGKWRDNHFITMEYIDGGNLKDWMKDNPENMEKKIIFMLQICDGLNAAHKLAIIHRDIKPENILIDKARIAKIVDFGIARGLDIASKTVDGSLLGTPEFISPEQIQGHKLDKRSDIYSLGVLMYHLFAGKLPFSGTNVGHILYKHLSEKPIPPNTLNPKVPAWLDKIILKALEKEPSKRYQNTEEIIKEIKNNWK